MEKKPLIGVRLCAIVLLVLSSLSNVVGYQTIPSSHQQIRKEGVNQKELVFQTIIDIANTKEIQRIILKSQMMSRTFLGSDEKIPTPITKNQLRRMYFLGLLLSKSISKSRMQSILGKYQISNQKMQEEITTLIEKNAILRGKITQVQHSECDCENTSTMNRAFPVACFIIMILIVPTGLLCYLFEILEHRCKDEGKPILATIFNFSEMITLFLNTMVFVVGYYLDCWGEIIP